MQGAGVASVDWRVSSFENAFVKAVHVVRSERWLESAHFVKDTAEGPDVTLGIVWLILPDLGGGIVRCACLRVEESFFGNFRHVQIAEFGHPVLLKENIRAFEIAMQNVAYVECFQCLDHLEYDFPNVTLINLAVAFLILDDFLVEITIVEIVHHDAEARSGIFKKCFFVTDDAPVTISHKNHSS